MRLAARSSFWLEVCRRNIQGTGSSIVTTFNQVTCSLLLYVHTILSTYSSDRNNIIPYRLAAIAPEACLDSIPANTCLEMPWGMSQHTTFEAIRLAVRPTRDCSSIACFLLLISCPAHTRLRRSGGVHCTDCRLYGSTATGAINKQEFFKTDLQSRCSPVRDLRVYVSCEPCEQGLVNIPHYTRLSRSDSGFCGTEVEFKTWQGTLPAVK